MHNVGKYIYNRKILYAIYVSKSLPSSDNKITNASQVCLVFLGESFEQLLAYLLGI